MTRTSRILAYLLTYAGLIPFLASVLAAYGLSPHPDYAQALRAYAAVILAFLAGMQWAYALVSPHAQPRYLLFTSNLFALIACGALLLRDAASGLLLDAFCFITLLAMDLRLRDRGVIPRWFCALRLHATLVVVFCLVLILTSESL